MTIVVSSEGQIALPAELRERDGITAGQQFELERMDEGQYLLKRHTAVEEGDWVDWLLACPEKGWFQSIPSESTATL